MCNNEEVQAVCIRGCYYVAAHRPVSIKLASQLSFEVLAPGPYMIKSSRKKYKVTYVDPAQQRVEAKLFLMK